MYKVLIVDDEHMIKRSLYKMISESEHGFTVVGEAEDGQEALELISQTQPDLIITDISMPTMDGLELIKECRNRQLTCEIVILSGYGEFEYARQALHSDVGEYLLKPIRPDVMDNVLRTVREKLDLKQKALLERSNWMWSCKTMGTRIASLIWDLDEKEIQQELIRVHCTYREQSVDTTLFRHLCYELLTFIEKELEQRVGSGGMINQTESTRFSVAMDAAEAWQLLEVSLMEHVRAIQSKRKHGASQGIKTAVAFIEQNYMEEDLSLQVVAERMHISLSYASQSFKETMGVGFTQYLTGLRMEKAKEVLLQDLNCKTYEVATSVGYSDYPHFTKTFKKHFGCSPREYRKRIGFD